MEFLYHLLVGILVLSQHLHAAQDDSYRDSELLTTEFGLNVMNRSSFPPGFIFGAATSAYQVEGAWNVDGKGPSNWDTFTHKFPDKIANRANGDVAADSYHLYKEDAKLLKGLNADCYRFSISWPRIIPYGSIKKGINPKGIEYYNKLINELLGNGIQPWVTLFHWDIPQALEDEYGGFLSSNVVNDFHDYANLCFENFGDRVKHWITFNEPWTYSTAGYESGNFPPGRCSSWKKNNCTGGDSGTEPYLVSHHQLLAHANVVKLYKTKYQTKQKGRIGIALVSTWMVPFSNSSHDKRAATRAIDFMFGWFMNPLVYGKYPRSMQKFAGDRLPEFTKEQSEQLIGSYDFLGLNYYTAFYAGKSIPANKTELSYGNDQHVNLSWERNGKPIGEKAGSDWLHVYPRGLWKLLLYVNKKYQNPIIYITENGVDEANNHNLTTKQHLYDYFRIRYYYRHLRFVLKAIAGGVKVKGYYGWSLVDNFEWTEGYGVRFGISYVDFDTLKRRRKLSSLWFGRFLRK